MLSGSYTKLKRDDTWGVRVLGDKPPKPGDKVAITTKAGKEKTEVVKAVLWSSDGVYLCSIERPS